jgi:2-dehydropantoate 2-reductase
MPLRMLVVGAGAIGGYFGGRMLQAGRDLTFLVRPARRAQLAAHGLVVHSALGDAAIRNPPTALAEELRQPFDAILLSCKAYDLTGAIDAFAPAVGRETAIIPLLNGMRHLDQLAARFGAGRVLGGQCVISVRLDATGAIRHLNDHRSLRFGELDGNLSPRVRDIAALFDVPGIESAASAGIVHEMWEKWAFIATLAGITCLMRSTVGDIVQAGAGDLGLALYAECCAIAAANGHPVRPEAIARSNTMLTTQGSPLTASMLGDVERGARTEADHVLGDLLSRRPDSAGDHHALLAIAYAHLRAFEARRARTA